MKILHILYSGLGGHANVFFSMVKADKYKEFEQEALFNGVEELRQEYKELCDKNSIAWNFVKKIPGLDVTFYRKLKHHIKKADPQIIFLHGSSNIIPAKIAAVFSRGIKKIIVRETQANALKTRKAWTWLRLSMLLADKVIFLSESYNEEVKKRLGKRYKAKKISIIPNGIELNTYQPIIKAITNEIVIGMLSRIVIIKDHASLLHAFAILKQQQLAVNLKLKIAGNGENRQTLQELTRQLNIENDVEFTGTLNQEELPTFIQSLDIYIHASLGETMSTAIMQAMACKKTIIASDVAGINNMIIQNVSGLLVPVKDPESLAAAIQQLIKDRELASTLAANAYQFAFDNYSNTTMFNSYKQLFYS